MKKTAIVILFITLFSASGTCQINLVGAGFNQAAGYTEIVKWQALDSSSLSSYPTPLLGYLLASSVFDAFNSNYYLAGVTATSDGLLSFNTTTNTQTLLPLSSFSNIAEIDMSTGKIYTLRSDSAGYFGVIEYDIHTGTDSLLGMIHEPGLQGLTVDATSFDSNHGILYYIGDDGQASLCLFGIQVRNPVFFYTKITLLPDAPINNTHSVNYDNVHNTIFALNAEFDAGGNYIGSNVVEVDKATGEMTVRGQLTEFPYFQVGSSSFDQNSGNFLLVGFDTGFVKKMIVFNTLDNTYQTGYVPGSVSEIVCDNHAFAMNTYMTSVNTTSGKTGITLCPNPASSDLTITGLYGLPGMIQVSVYQLNGKLVLENKYPSPNTINLDVSALKPGSYLVKILMRDGIETKKLLIR